MTMGCATSICSQTKSLSTVTPRTQSVHNIQKYPNGNVRKSANSSLKSSCISPSVVSVGKKSSQWDESYELELKDIDDQSEGQYEFESDPECDQHMVDHCNNTQKGRTLVKKRGSLLSENSKWTVTVRLYASKRAPDQHSCDIPSVEETGSHYSSEEWHQGKSGSSQGSTPSAKGGYGKNDQMNQNGVTYIPKEYSSTKMGLKRDKGLGKLHHSHSERPITKEELARYEYIANIANPTYAWTQRHKPRRNQSDILTNPKAFQMGDGITEESRTGQNGISFYGNQDKYEHSGNLSTYLSLGTNHYRKTSLRGSNRRRNVDREENWQGLCDIDSSGNERPKTELFMYNPHYCDDDFESLRSTSPIDSLITDYLADTEIIEDFSGSTHSLVSPGKDGYSDRATVYTSGQGTSVSTSAKNSDSGPDSDFYDNLQRDRSVRGSSRKNHPQPKTHRPKAALRRHRSEPFHFLS